jgi:RNA polymerase sigma-70 factor (ECF subfamily)
MVAYADHDLVERLRGGSEDAAEELFERHWPQAWRNAFVLTGRAELAEEVVQEAFTKALASLRGFNGRSSFATWFHRIVVNSALNVRQRESRLVLGDPPELAAEVALPDHDPQLLAALRSLAEDRRLLVVLRYWLELTPREIGHVLAIPEGTVSSRLSRALEELRTTLEVNDDL